MLSLNALNWMLRLRRTWQASGALIVAGCLLLAQVRPALAEGSRDLYPSGATGSRASAEWRTSSYGPVGPPDSTIRRRTLLKVFANAGEFILAGSSAVGVTSGATQGDVLIFNPGLVTGSIGKEIIPVTASYQCSTQRASTGNPNLGRITSRLQELAGPDTIIDPANGTPGGAVPNGYVPCFYQAPVTGIYDVEITGPYGSNDNNEILPLGDIALTSPGNFDATQATSIAAWDVTTRSTLISTTDLTGRLFAYYLALFTGGNGRPLNSTVHMVTLDGYRYQTDLRGMDPNGFLLYGNQVGFYNSDGQTPLYHDVLSAVGATNANQLTQLQGGADLAPPLYPVFFNPPDNATLNGIGIPLAPTAPTVTQFQFTGAVGNTAYLGQGGIFTFTSNISGVYEIIISRDGVDFDPANPLNRVLRGVTPPGTNTIPWDGNDNSGTPFPVGNNYSVLASVHAGEYHFPMIDVENSPNGGPTYTLLNPPGGVCPFPVGCSAAHYDDRGYQTLSGQTVGTAGSVLCGANPPSTINSGPGGFDSSGAQRAFGAATGGNAGVPCNGAFGDTKGLDLWTYFPSNIAATVLNIIQIPTDTPTPTITPTPSDTPTPLVTATGQPPPSSTPADTQPPAPTAVGTNTPTPVPTLSLPLTGFGPGSREVSLTALLWLLAALAPLAAWGLWRLKRR